MALAIVFALSTVLGILLLLRSSLPWTWRVAYSGALLALAVIAFVFATHSQVSPFGKSQGVAFGITDTVLPVTIGVVGAILGVLGSHFVKLDKRRFKWRSLLKPLCIAPAVIAPTVKLIETAGEVSFLSMLLLFGLSYQNGFFWEKVLKEDKEGN